MNLCYGGYGSIARSHPEVLRGEDVTLGWIVGRLPTPTSAFAAEFGFVRAGIDLAEALADPAVDAAAVRPTMHVLQAAQEQFDTWAPPGARHIWE